jgi:hypothetical protein
MTRSTKPDSAKSPRKTSRRTSKTAQPAAAASTNAAPPTAGPRGKIGIVVAMLRRAEGATVPDLMEATGWQAHSVRGAMAGAIKKKLGLVVTSTKTDGARVYCIEAADGVA